MNKLIERVKSSFKRSLEPNDIDKKQMEDLIFQGAILVDVRSPQEYKEGHLDGAINIPEYDIRKVAKDKLTDLHQKIIVYCDSGSRSKRASKRLEKMGYDNVYNLYKGTEN